MKKTELLEKVKQLERLPNEEKSYLINLIKAIKKYEPVREDKLIHRILIKNEL